MAILMDLHYDIKQCIKFTYMLRGLRFAALKLSIEKQVDLINYKIDETLLVSDAQNCIYCFSLSRFR